MNRADVESIWAAVEAPEAAGDLVGRPPPETDPALGAMLAVDHHGTRHLLIAADSESALPSRPATKGLEVGLDELRVGERSPNRYFDVACKDSTMNANFTVVATEILEALGADRRDIAETLDAILDRWRWFWDRAPDALTAEEAIGLFGELWFLEFWLAPIDFDVLNAWTGPSGDRHDFKWTAASVEVKATRARSDGAATHRITALDQLEDAESGQLHLFSLRATPDPIGRHSLNGSIDRLRELLTPTAHLLGAFEERLGVLGYSPAHRQHYDVPLRVVAEGLYRVSEGFPRLTTASFADGLPDGVDNVAYTLDLAACADWLIATSPGEVSRNLRRTLARPSR